MTGSSKNMRTSLPAKAASKTPANRIDASWLQQGDVFGTEGCSDCCGSSVMRARATRIGASTDFAATTGSRYGLGDGGANGYEIGSAMAEVNSAGLPPSCRW